MSYAFKFCSISILCICNLQKTFSILSASQYETIFEENAVNIIWLKTETSERTKGGEAEEKSDDGLGPRQRGWTHYSFLPIWSWYALMSDSYKRR